MGTPGIHLDVRDQNFLISTPAVNEDRAEATRSPREYTSIVISTNQGSISMEAIKLAMQHQLEVLWLDEKDTNYARIWYSRPTVATILRQAQLRRQGTAAGITDVMQWLREGEEQRAQYLSELKALSTRSMAGPVMEAWKSASRTLSEYVGEDTDALLQLEAACDAAWYEVLRSLLPPDLAFVARSSRPAPDPANALFDYAHNWLHARIDRCLLLAGLDPGIGYVHGNRLELPHLVADFSPAFRPIVDFMVMQVLLNRAVDLTGFHTVAGSCQILRPTRSSMADYLINELHAIREDLQGRKQSYYTLMQDSANRYAQSIRPKVAKDD